MESFGWLQEWWPQVVGIGALIFIMARTKEQIHELRKDVDSITERNTFSEHIRLRAEFDAIIKQQEKQISSLWEYTNKLRDRIDQGSTKR